MKKNIIFGLLAFSFASASCKKAPAIRESDLQIITTRTWQLTGLSVSPEHQGVTNVLATWDACRLDETYHFNDGGQLIVLSRALSCDPSEPSVLIGQWMTYPMVFTSYFNGFRLPWETGAHTFESYSLAHGTFTLSENIAENGVEYTYTWVFSSV